MPGARPRLFSPGGAAVFPVATASRAVPPPVADLGTDDPAADYTRRVMLVSTMGERGLGAAAPCTTQSGRGRVSTFRFNALSMPMRAIMVARRARRPGTGLRPLPVTHRALLGLRQAGDVVAGIAQSHKLTPTR